MINAWHKDEVREAAAKVVDAIFELRNAVHREGNYVTIEEVLEMVTSTWEAVKGV